MDNENQAGYTIVELLIVIAVAALIAISAFSLVRGQQMRNEYSLSFRDFETKLTDTANDVAKGYFPDMGGNARCQAVPGGGISFVAGSEIQGGSNECVFAGKIIEFDGASTSRLNVFSIAAPRSGGDGNTVSSLDDLVNGDLQIAQSATGGRLEETLQLLYGLQVKSVTNNGADVGAIAFMSGFGNETSTSLRFSGAPETDLYWLSSTGGHTSPGAYNDPADDGIEICLEQNTGGRTVLVKLGTEGRQLTTTTEADAGC